MRVTKRKVHKNGNATIWLRCDGPLGCGERCSIHAEAEAADDRAMVEVENHVCRWRWA